MNLPANLTLSDEIRQALAGRRPIVALESTVITHGLPYPENLALARDMEADVRAHGAVPATIAVLEGLIHVGLLPEQLERLARPGEVHKISTRDFSVASMRAWNGGTTVAGTMRAASLAGICVFATGGIGGVHRQPAYDISADLPELAHTPLVVVCAGAKAILDLDATLEYLETAAVPVLGYQTDEFPAFYSRSSGLKTSGRADTPAQVAAVARAHWGLGLHSAILVANPLPEEDALPPEALAGAIQQALKETVQQNIRGQRVTPFLLARVSELTGGSSLRANLALLRNNARLAAQIAGCLAESQS